VIRLLLLLLFNSWLVAPCSLLWAGDAVAIGYNAQGVWTAVTYYSSSTPKGGKDYKNQKQAEEAALRDVRRRSQTAVTNARIASSSDTTGFAAVARGKDESGKDTIVVGRGKTKSEAENSTVDLLKAAGVGADYKIAYRYFSYGADSK